MAEERYLEDFSIGQTFRSGPIAVTAAEIKAFAFQFDPQPFHLDEQAAATTFFGGLVASGWHTAALTMRLIVDSDLKIAGGSIGAGAEELRWPRPVRPGDTLHAVSEVLDVRPSKSRSDKGIIKMRTQALNQDNQPVMIFVANMIVPRRPSWSSSLELAMTGNYQPIENYGIIGNMRTAALVGMDGSIDWLCLPYFDSPSVFAAVLDDHKGGRFRIAPARDHLRRKQYYWPGTNILITRFLHADGVGEVEDYMPVGAGAAPDELIRRVRMVRGEFTFRLECRPAFDYARAPHEVHVTENGVRFDGPATSLGLAGSVPLKADGPGVTAEFTLREGEHATFALRRLDPADDHGRSLGFAEAEDMFRDTVAYWRRWLSHCTYTGRWREVVERSALALKLLSFEPTGAIVAAPTCSLPESIGGPRNWDYRYTWVRDAAFTLYSLQRIGFTEEAVRFKSWLKDRWHRPDGHGTGPLQPIYGIDGRADLTEQTLDHLEGYRGSGPVRIGNGAHQQLQLDIYGELMDGVYLHNKYVEPIGYDDWARLRHLLDWLCDNWRRHDESIWEVRGGQRAFVYSKYMCWVALDRGLRLADKRSFPADRARWLTVRDEIYDEIMTRGWNPGRQAFTQSFGSNALDASSLLMPLVFFMAPNDPRMLGTIDAVRRPLDQGGLTANGLVYRYDPAAAPDGLSGCEGTFNMCSFWLVEALTRAGRTDPARLEDARLLFEQMLGYSNHLGLYAEQTGASGEALGNFPQAFTHLGLISAAFNLDRTLGAG